MTMWSDLTPRKGVVYTSYSGLTRHRACPQQWSYAQLYGLSRPPSDDAKVEARFGTWWHALRCAESIERISSPAYATKWFQRTLTPVNRNIAKAHLQAAVDSEQDSRTTTKRVLRRGEAPRNMTGAACRYCDYAKLCRAQMIGGADGEYQIEEYGLRARVLPDPPGPVEPEQEVVIPAEK
jgi:hypothetical protein